MNDPLIVMIEKVVKELQEENARLRKYIENLSCCCSGCTKHNQDIMPEYCIKKPLD